LIDGTVFDSSIERGEPATFTPAQVIDGWTEALQLMGQGEKWEIFVPPHLGYGSAGAPGVIPPGAALNFTLELIEVKSEYQE